MHHISCNASFTSFLFHLPVPFCFFFFPLSSSFFIVFFCLIDLTLRIVWRIDLTLRIVWRIDLTLRYLADRFNASIFLSGSRMSHVPVSDVTRPRVGCQYAPPSWGRFFLNIYLFQFHRSSSIIFSDRLPCSFLPLHLIFNNGSTSSPSLI